MRRRPHRSSALAALALVALALAPGPEPARAQSTPPTGPAVSAPAPYDAVLRALPQATAVHIVDGWMGLSPIAPIEHHYDFERTAAGFRARTRCGARNNTHSPPETTVPTATVLNAMVRLGGIAVHGGAYTPRITHTDDYPNVTLSVETPAGSVTLTTRSQGGYAAPWEITHPTGTHAVVTSSEPGDVVRALIAASSGTACRDWTSRLRVR